MAGDHTALAKIYNQYAQGLHKTAVAMTSNRLDADDMVQEVFCIAAEKLVQLHDSDRLEAWLHAILRHEVFRRTKMRKRTIPIDFQADTAPKLAAIQDPLAEGGRLAMVELADLLRSATLGLDERDRHILELSLRQGLTGADLAVALGVTSEQTYTLVYRMRGRIEASLGAFTVAKMGRKRCTEIASILVGWDGEFSVLIRKRVSRHIGICPVCRATRTIHLPSIVLDSRPEFWT